MKSQRDNKISITKVQKRDKKIMINCKNVKIKNAHSDAIF